MQRRLELLQGRYPLLPHSLALNLAGADGPHPAYLRQVARLARQLQPPWVSDHLAVTAAGGTAIGHLSPPVWNQPHLDVLCRNVERVQRQLPCPLVLECLAQPFHLPGATMPEAEFVSRLVDRTGVGLLLDVANTWINAQNTGTDPMDYINALPAGAVVQLHLAGGHQDGHRHIDSHSAPVPEPVWQLLARVLARCPVRAVILERDDHLPPYAELYAEAERIHRYLHASRTAAPAGAAVHPGQL